MERGKQVRMLIELSRVNLFQVSEKVKRLKERGQKVGLITGCFDILHSGHRKLFELSKNQVDILVIGVDCDETVRLNKKGRPINTLSKRVSNLEKEKDVNFVFPIKDVFKFGGTPESIECHRRIWQQIEPDFLITSSRRDKFAELKREQLSDFNIKLLDIRTSDSNSTTKITSNTPKDL